MSTWRQHLRYNSSEQTAAIKLLQEEERKRNLSSRRKFPSRERERRAGEEESEEEERVRERREEEKKREKEISPRDGNFRRERERERRAGDEESEEEKERVRERREEEKERVRERREEERKRNLASSLFFSSFSFSEIISVPNPLHSAATEISPRLSFSIFSLFFGNYFRPESTPRGEKEISPGDGNFRRERERDARARKKARMKRERMNKYVDKTWQPRGGRNNKTIHLSGNADVVPQTGHRKR